MSEQKHPEAARCNRPENQIETLATLYALGELAPEQRANLEAHARECAACSAAIAREQHFHQALAASHQPADGMDPDGLLLARCRSELAEALDELDGTYAATGVGRRAGWRGALRAGAWWATARRTLVLHPAFSLAILVMAGFLAGILSQRWPSTEPAGAPPVLTVSAPPKLTDEQLQNAGGASINWVTPAGSRDPSVQVQFMSQTPLSVTGAPQDADVRRALTYVLANGEQFDPGARLNSLDALRSLSADVDVRQALCVAARTDRNPGVRIKALETLQGLEADPMVRQTLIEALASDANPGVRVQAINLLVNALRAEAGAPGPADPRILSVLRDRLQNDSNQYVRLQSGIALHQLGAE